MNKKETKVIIVLIIIFIIIGIILFNIKPSNDYIKKDNVKIENDDILSLSEEEKEKCIEGLIKYLNDEYYYKCNTIKFYNNELDESKSSKYLYALVIGQDESLVEITNLGDGKFKYLYIGNELTPDNTSDVTGVSYQQIINPKKYQREKELEEIREEGKTALPDDTEMP